MAKRRSTIPKYKRRREPPCRGKVIKVVPDGHGGIGYMYAKGEILVRDDYLERVLEILGHRDTNWSRPGVGPSRVLSRALPVSPTWATSRPCPQRSGRSTRGSAWGSRRRIMS